RDVCDIGEPAATTLFAGAAANQVDAAGVRCRREPRRRRTLYRTRILDELEKRVLRRVLDILRIAKKSPTDRKHQRAIRLDQPLARSRVAIGQPAIKQLIVHSHTRAATDAQTAPHIQTPTPANFAEIPEIFFAAMKNYFCARNRPLRASDLLTGVAMGW